MPRPYSPHERSIVPAIRKDLERKYILLSGPRQVGKTTLTKGLVPEFEYLNFDEEGDRAVLLRKSWDRKKPLLILDELHKMKKWKTWLKGIYDTEGLKPAVVVTGSARLDLARKMGDSMAGRYFQYRLFPYDIKELSGRLPPEEAYGRLLAFSGFPEPLFDGTEEFYGKWKVTHTDIILRQDLLTLETIRDIPSLETLIYLLAERVGSTTSYASLARDLQKDPKTVKHWLSVLESLFIVFKVTPYHRNIARSTLKEPKYYFYDVARVRGDESAKLENLVAFSLQKEIHFRSDAKGKQAKVYFLRLKSREEIDFLVKPEEGESVLVEVKLKDPEPTASFRRFRKYFPGARQIQLVKSLKREATYPGGVEVRKAVDWLEEMPL